MIEFAREPISMADFTWELDQALKSLNSDYEAKRQKDIAMRAPMVHTMPKGVFHEWLRRKGKLGGQHKVPRLNNDRMILDELRTIMDELVS
jgi:GH3 auxin-responsive promoter